MRDDGDLLVVQLKIRAAASGGELFMEAGVPQRQNGLQ
jgi:hypothetical protein